MFLLANIQTLTMTHTTLKELPYKAEINFLEKDKDNTCIDLCKHFFFNIIYSLLCFSELSDKLGSLCTVARFETIWRIPLLHHLLSRLAVKRKYVIEEVSRDHPHVCNCCGEEITGSYGDNSMGKAMLIIAVGEAH